MSLDFLWQGKEPEKKVKLSEGGDFTAGFAGRWTVAPMWRVWDGSGLDLAELGVKPNGMQSFSSGSFYYFVDSAYDEGAKLCKALGLKFGPKQVWRWEMPVQDSVGLSEAAQQAFGPVVAMEVGIGAYGGRDRAELHMIALPSAIQAIAIAAGILKEPVYDYKKLLVDANSIDSDYQHRLIGDDANFEESELWKARIALWATLGENNPKAYTVGQDSKKFDVTGAVLSELMKILYVEGSRPWARVMRVPHPRVDAESKEGKHLGVMCIDRVWRNEAECRAETGDEGTEVKVSSAPNGLVVPTRWGAGADAGVWKEWLTDYLTEKKLIGKPIPIIVKELGKLAEELDAQYACTVEEITPWLPEVLK